MFNNVGAKIRTYAVVVFWIDIAFIAIASIYLFLTISRFAGIFAAACGFVCTYIGSMFVVAMGELITDVRANERNTAEIKRLLAEQNAQNSNSVNTVFVQAKAESTAVRNVPVKKSARPKPETRWVGSRSSQALKYLDKVVKFNFRTDEDCLRWTLRNLNTLPDADKEKLAELLNYKNEEDIGGFFETLYRLYNSID